MWLREKTFFPSLALLCSFDARLCFLKQFLWQLRKRTDDLHSALHDALESPTCQTYTWNCIMTGVCHWRCLLHEPWFPLLCMGPAPQVHRCSALPSALRCDCSTEKAAERREAAKWLLIKPHPKGGVATWGACCCLLKTSRAGDLWRSVNQAENEKSLESWHSLFL